MTSSAEFCLCGHFFHGAILSLRGVTPVHKRDQRARETVMRD
jgi:hypothetical protein